MPAYYVVARFISRPEHIAQTESLLRSFVAPARADPGCLCYDLHRVQDDPNSFIIFDGRADQNALERHFTDTHVARTLKALEPLLAETSNVKVCERIS